LNIGITDVLLPFIHQALSQASHIALDMLVSHLIDCCTVIAAIEAEKMPY